MNFIRTTKAIDPSKNLFKTVEFVESGIDSDQRIERLIMVRMYLLPSD